MLKHVFLGFVMGANAIDGDRWYFRFHAPEAVRYLGPWIRRYESYRSYDPPPAAERFGAVGGRLTEFCYANVEDFKEAYDQKMAFTPPSFPVGPENPMVAAVTMIPIKPTNDFLDKQPPPEEKTILRWCQIFKYPDGVSLAEGDKWYLDVHSQEVKQQPGLMKYVSHRTTKEAVEAQPPFAASWHRMSELWYEDFAAWQKANVDSPPRYTPPPWGGKEAPFVEMKSIFVRSKPDVDFLKGASMVP